MGEQLMKDKVDDIYEAAREAGKALVETDELPQELLDRVAQELMPLDAFVNGANEYFRMELDRLKEETG